MQIVPWAEANLIQTRTKLLLAGRIPCRNHQKIVHCDSAKADGLLKSVANAQFGALGYAKPRNILAVKKQMALRRPENAGDDFGKRRLAAAVGAGDHGKAPAFQLQIDILKKRPPAGQAKGDIF